MAEVAAATLLIRRLGGPQRSTRCPPSFDNSPAFCLGLGQPEFQTVLELLVLPSQMGR